MKKILGIMIVGLVLNLHAKKEILYSCNEAKSELYDLVKETGNQYTKDSLSLTLYEENNKYYVKSTSTSEIIYIGGNQFIEKVSSGHSVLYTIHKDHSLLTIQKSYDLAGPIMVNIYLHCVSSEN
jgi:hypothetical protein